jgi:hypothetical protein
MDDSEVAVNMLLAQVPTQSRYSIENVVSYDLRTDTLTMDVDSEYYARSYRVEWRHTEEELAIVYHVQVDGDGLQPQTYDLDPVEIRELLRWIECSADVDEIVSEQRVIAGEMEDAWT